MAEADGDRRRPADGASGTNGPDASGASGANAAGTGASDGSGPSTPGASTPGPNAPGANAAGARTPGASASSDSRVPELLGLSTEERAVRELLHGAVSGIQPAAEGLPRIRRAVPRRRAARRGAWTGAAALAFVVAIGLPVLHEGEHLGLSGGPGSADAKSPAATSPGGAAGSAGGTGAASHADPSGTGGVTPSPGSTTAPHTPGGGATHTDGGVAPSGTSGTDDGGIVPLCTRTDLGEGAAQVGTADGAGRIYGSFTVYNVSGRSCRLGGPGSVAVTAVSGGDRGRVHSADHSPGDPAAGLPAMDGEPPVLAPRAGYRVPFAWVPDQTCTGSPGIPATNGVNQVALRAEVPAAESGAPASVTTDAPSANPPASSSPSAGPTSAPSPTASPTGNPPTAQPTVTIAHTPAPGSPAVATATLPVSCGGTVYRGGVQGLGGPAPQPSGSPTAG